MLAVVALLTMGAGAGLAQGLDSSTRADEQQYGTSERLGVIGEIESEAPSEEAAPAPAAQPAPAQAAAPSAPVQQAEGELPFTGFAAVSVLLLGVALLGSGLVLRRSTRRKGESTG